MDALIASLEGSVRIPTPQAQAIYRALAAPDVYGELVIESKWTPGDFEEWVAQTLLTQLLRTGRPLGSGRKDGGA
jgi:hypothetical protein